MRSPTRCRGRRHGNDTGRAKMGRNPRETIRSVTLRRFTIKDVAERAQVSLKTVSRVINNEAGVQASTRDRVQVAIAELDYQPDPSARSLRSAQSYAIGLMYDNPTPYYVIAVQNGVLSVCRENGYGLQIHPCDSTVPDLADEL